MSYGRRKEINVAGIVVVIFIIAFVILFAAATPTCTDEVTTRRVLTEQGYTNIRITGYRYFGGGEDDVFNTGFTATSPKGHMVSGCVTRGLLKGSTVRLD